MSIPIVSCAKVRITLKKKKKKNDKYLNIFFLQFHSSTVQSAQKEDGKEYEGRQAEGAKVGLA